MGNTGPRQQADTHLFRDIFDASPIGIAVENLEGQLLFVNPALCSFFGYSGEELRSKHCVDFSPPQDAEKDWALFQQLRAGSIHNYQLDKHYFRRDGSLLWGRLSVSLLNSSPSPFVLAMIEDITDRKKAEDARLRHAIVIESSDDAIASGTLDGIIVSWNTGAQKIYGYTEAEAIGNSINMLVPPELADEENEILRAVKAGNRIEHLETVRVTKAEKRINVSLSISPIKDSNGKTVGISGIARDITARKRAEEALVELNRALEAQSALLKSSEELLKIFVKNVPAAVAMFDCEMRYLQVSDRWCADYSVQSSEILGRSHYEVFLDMPERWREAHRRGLAGETVRAEDYRWDSQFGTRWQRWEIRPWQNPAGLQGGILIFVEDITPQKQMEEALLGVSRRLIEAQEQERARIGRELHDDINQRLAMLSLELEELKDNPSEVEARAQELRKRAAEISNDVQALSHDLHSSKLEYLGVAAGMKSWCKEFGERQKMEIGFKSDVPGALPLDVGRTLFRVLQEALHNASKHSSVKRVDVQLREDSHEVHLIVNDIGRGFDLEAALQGKGLGLTSMRERVRLVNGTITIDSKPQGGTMIHVRVPIESDRAKLACG